MKSIIYLISVLIFNFGLTNDIETFKIPEINSYNELEDVDLLDKLINLRTPKFLNNSNLLDFKINSFENFDTEINSKQNPINSIYYNTLEPLILCNQVQKRFFYSKFLLSKIIESARNLKIKLAQDMTLNKKEALLKNEFQFLKLTSQNITTSYPAYFDLKVIKLIVNWNLIHSNLTSLLFNYPYYEQFNLLDIFNQNIFLIKNENNISLQMNIQPTILCLSLFEIKLNTNDKYGSQYYFYNNNAEYIEKGYEL